MSFPQQTPKDPKAIKAFTESTTFDLNIKTIILQHSIKDASHLPWL